MPNRDLRTIVIHLFLLLLAKFFLRRFWRVGASITTSQLNSIPSISNDAREPRRINIKPRFPGVILPSKESMESQTRTLQINTSCKKPRGLKTSSAPNLVEKSKVIGAIVISSTIYTHRTIQKKEIKCNKR
jgi:hypothetical protein